MEKKIKDIMEKVFDINLQNNYQDISVDNIENWDSLRHMHLVISLEEEFGVEFSNEQIEDSLSLKIILLTLEELLN